jgi:hypothetical protein
VVVWNGKDTAKKPFLLSSQKEPDMANRERKLYLAIVLSQILAALGEQLSRISTGAVNPNH